MLIKFDEPILQSHVFIILGNRSEANPKDREQISPQEMV